MIVLTEAHAHALRCHSSLPFSSVHPVYSLLFLPFSAFLRVVGCLIFFSSSFLISFRWLFSSFVIISLSFPRLYLSSLFSSLSSLTLCSLFLFLTFFSSFYFPSVLTSILIPPLSLSSPHPPLRPPMSFNVLFQLIHMYCLCYIVF